MAINWIDVNKELPKAEQEVYIVVEYLKYPKGVIRRQTIACYIPYMTVKEEDFMDECFFGEGDYNESEDEYYTPEGFYECQIEAEINWKLTGKVTQWMPLIEYPNNEEDN